MRAPHGDHLDLNRHMKSLTRGLVPQHQVEGNLGRKVGVPNPLSELLREPSPVLTTLNLGASEEEGQWRPSAEVPTPAHVPADQISSNLLATVVGLLLGMDAVVEGIPGSPSSGGGCSEEESNNWGIPAKVEGKELMGVVE